MYEELAELWRTLGDPTRLHILGLLRVRDACVCELVELLPVTQPAVSQHLRKLKHAGLVRDYREKSWIYYSLRIDVSPVVSSVIRDLPVPDRDRVWLQTHAVGAACTNPGAVSRGTRHDRQPFGDYTDKQ